MMILARVYNVFNVLQILILKEIFSANLAQSINIVVSGTLYFFGRQTTSA